MKFENILVPHDGSKTSDRALDTAIKIAKFSRNSHIIILHVIPELQMPLVLERPMRSPKTGELTTLSEYWKEMCEGIRISVLKMLAGRKNKSEKSGISAETRSETGYPSDVILRTAGEDVDIIVMGTTGLRGLSKIKALGSVARRVSEESVCPVLLVH